MSLLNRDELSQAEVSEVLTVEEHSLGPNCRVDVRQNSYRDRGISDVLKIKTVANPKSFRADRSALVLMRCRLVNVSFPLPTPP